jgi:hypothetical protein
MRKYHPAHAAVRAVRSLPKWARAGILGVTASGSIAGLAVAALPAGAAGVGGNYYSTAASGYKAAGAQFRYVSATTYLRADSKDVAQPFAEIQQSCASNAPGPEVELIPSLNGDGTWDANADLNSAGVDGHSGNNVFTAGQYVVLSIYYNKWSHEATFMVRNQSGSQVYTAWANIGQTSLKCAGVGTVDIPAINGKFVPPSSAQKLNRFTGVQLTSYSGHRAGLLSWWTAHKYLMVGSTDTHSPVEAEPGSTNGSSFTVSLLP